jgi:hypothetical protein
MSKESPEKCPYLRVANDGAFIPLACTQNYAPKKVGEFIFADPNCSKVKRGFSNEYCEKVLDENAINLKSGIILEQKADV